MPITPYVRPQETITQNLRTTPAPSVNRRNPLVIGPEFLIGNYDPAALYEQDFATAASGSFLYQYLDSAGDVVAYNSATHTIDLTTVKLQANGIEVRVSAQAALISSNATRNALTNVIDAVATKFFTGPVADLHLNQNMRPLQIGDVLYINTELDPDVIYRRTVVGFVNDSNGRATSLVLNGNLPPGAVAVTFYVTAKYSGILDTSVLVTNTVVPTSSDVDYTTLTFKKAVFGVDATGVDCAAVVPAEAPLAKVSVYFRAVRKVSELDGVITVNSLNDLAQFGPLTIDNWLAYGAYQAFMGNQKSKIYVLRTGGDTVTDFTDALNKIRATDYYYALTPMTDDELVKDLVAAHCDEMSNKYNRNFRRCYFGTDSPPSFRVWGLRPNGATVRVAQVDSVNKRIILSIADQAYSSFLTDLSVGDTVFIGSSNAGAVITDGAIAVTISRIISASEIEYGTIISGTPADGPTLNITATRKDSAANVVKYFQERNVGSRRAVNVWSDNPVAFGVSSPSSTRIPAKFIAAEIAGLRCALLPQQGLTMTEVLSVDTAPGMFTRFTPEQLDVIASNGVMIVTQEVEGGEMFIRHQLTTKTDAGALAYEDNVGVIADEFSYRVKDAFRGYIGRRNVTRETMAEMAAELKDLAIASTQESIANREIGPMVLRFFSADDKEGEVTVRVSGNLADHIETYVRLRVPLPINGIDHYIDVETSVEL